MRCRQERLTQMKNLKLDIVTKSENETILKIELRKFHQTGEFSKLLYSEIDKLVKAFLRLNKCEYLHDDLVSDVVMYVCKLAPDKLQPRKIETSIFKIIRWRFMDLLKKENAHNRKVKAVKNFQSLN